MEGVVPEQIVCKAGVDVATGMGLTVIITDTGIPAQLLAVGVIVIIPLMAVLPALVAVNKGTVFVPVAVRPMAVLLLLQL